MALDANTVTTLLSRVDGPSFILGLGCGTIALGFALLVLYNRSQRSQLLLSLRLEQSGRKTERLAGEVEQQRDLNTHLGERNRLLERTNIELEATLHETKILSRERQQLFEQTRLQLEEDFNNLSRKVLSEQGRVLRRQHADNLEQLLLPVRDQLKGFKKRVEDVYDRESRDRLSLIKEIEHLKTLNERISQDALNLTRALKGNNKLQGQWGEMVLEQLLSQSGLREGQDFEVQVSLHDQEGRLKQPDIVIHLPGNRDVVIDAKVSLQDYLEACKSAGGKEQAQHLQRHAGSLQRHINRLSSKEYQQLPGLTTLDFVLLFIPVEGAFQEAVNSNQDLLSKAMKKRVILAGPSTLLAILRTIHHMWRLDEQKKNSALIAREAGNLYDKFVGFIESFNEVGMRLDQAKQSWQTAEKRLSTGRGNVLSKVDNLKKLGVEPSKELPDTSQKTY